MKLNAQGQLGMELLDKINCLYKQHVCMYIMLKGITNIFYPLLYLKSRHLLNYNEDYLYSE
jgi:hypothetical protein